MDEPDKSATGVNTAPANDSNPCQKLQDQLSTLERKIFKVTVFGGAIGAAILIAWGISFKTLPERVQETLNSSEVTETIKALEKEIEEYRSNAQVSATKAQDEANRAETAAEHTETKIAEIEKYIGRLPNLTDERGSPVKLISGYLPHAGFSERGPGGGVQAPINFSKAKFKTTPTILYSVTGGGSLNVFQHGIIERTPRDCNVVFWRTNGQTTRKNDADVKQLGVYWIAVGN